MFVPDGHNSKAGNQKFAIFRILLGHLLTNYGAKKTDMFDEHDTYQKHSIRDELKKIIVKTTIVCRQLY